MSLFPTQKSADIEGPYRYRLERRWGPGRPFVVIGCNPSTADASEDDPTVRRCLGFARSHDCDALVMVNVFAYRATNVKDLGPLSLASATGPRNFMAVWDACRLPGAVVVCAWGSRGKLIQELRHAPLLLSAKLRANGIQLHALRLTKNQDPEHPLYLPADLKAQPWGLAGDAG